MDELIGVSAQSSTWPRANNLRTLAIIRSVGWGMWSHYFFQYFSVLQNYTSIKLLKVLRGSLISMFLCHSLLFVLHLDRVYCSSFAFTPRLP